MNNLLKNAALAYGGAAIANANNTDSNSTIFDMAGYDGILFITTITDCVQAGVATLKAEGNTANSDSGMEAITGATVSATSGANDDLNGKVLIVDVYRPTKRYVQGVRVSATQNIAFGEVLVVQYKSSVGPVTQGSTVAGSAFVVGS